MPADRPLRLLFSGYAPVHFLSFLPVYQLLEEQGEIECWLSGGFRKKHDDGEVSFHLEGFYEPHPVDQSHVLGVDQARREDFDVLVCAHLSDALFPRSAKTTVQIFHGVSFKNYAVREKALAFDHLCLPGSYHARRYLERGLVRPGGSRVLVTGFAKLDQLFTGKLDRARTLNELGLDPSKPTLLYAPTGDKNNSLETMGEEVIRLLAAEGDWNLMVKPHDHPKRAIDWFDRLAEFQGPRMRLVRALDVVPYLHAADLLISDASSVVTEFTALDRPIVLLDVPKLFKRVLVRGGALDLETYGHRLGPVVEKASDVVQAVRQQLSDASAFGEVRRAMAADVFHDPGNATRRVAAVIRNAAGLLPELPDDVRLLDPLDDALPVFSGNGQDGGGGRA